MFGRSLLEGMVGKEVSHDAAYSFGLGQRLARRCHYASTRLRVMQWVDEKDWQALREWLLRDYPSEEPLPVMSEQHFLSNVDKREIIRLTLSGAWHALKSYQCGNSATELAQEMCEKIESTARMLGITLEGAEMEAEARADQP